MTLIWAHARAESFPVENTLQAFAAAIDDGADGLEFDVHQTSDGVLVCAHDGVLKDKDGTSISVADTEYAGLRNIDVGTEETGFVGLPRLDEVFEIYAPTDRQLNIEVKNLPRPYPGMAENVVRHAARSGMADRIVVSSFHHRLLREIQEQDASLRVAALYADGLLAPWDYLKAVGIPEAHPHYVSLSEPGEIEGYREAGIPVRAWTVDDPADWARLLEAGIDGIITDLPASAKALRDRQA
jgi:glycerophosphoryl diester phosphodiesterase